MGHGFAGALCVEREVQVGRKWMDRAPRGSHCTLGASWLGLRGGRDLRCERGRAGVPEALPCRDPHIVRG